MAMVRWDPFQDLIALQDRMNQLFDQTWARSRREREGVVAAAWSPAVDVYETPEGIVLKVELPGLNKEDIDIQIKDNTVTLKGERHVEKDVKQENYLRVERAHGAFHRTFTLPTAIQTEKVRAVFKDGVLELNIPKAEDAKPKQIKIEVK